MSLGLDFLSYLDTLPVFDGHEHLSYPVNGQRGFFDILHYAQSDLLSAGMPRKLDDASQTLSERAELFARYYAKSCNTAYFRAVRRYAAGLYGIKRLEGDDLIRLHAMVRENDARAEAWYQNVLEDKCHIRTALTIHDGSQTRHAILIPVVYLDFLLRGPQIQFVSKRLGQDASFDQYLDYVDDWLRRQFEFGVMAGKFGTPYWRDMDFIPADKAAAEREFYSGDERMPSFEGFIFHRVLAEFERRGVPVQFHTGHVDPQSADMRAYRNEWSDPSPFARLAAMYPRLKIVLLHTGFPYSDGYFSLVKNVPNIYADFSWIYVISPMLAERNLNLAIETVPLCKVVGFGGDAQSVEMTYGHLCMAKEVIARVFAHQVARSWFSRADSEAWMAALLYDNGAAIYAMEDS